MHRRTKFHRTVAEISLPWNSSFTALLAEAAGDDGGHCRHGCHADVVHGRRSVAASSRSVNGRSQHGRALVVAGVVVSNSRAVHALGARLQTETFFLARATGSIISRRVREPPSAPGVVLTDLISAVVSFPAVGAEAATLLLVESGAVVAARAARLPRTHPAHRRAPAPAQIPRAPRLPTRALRTRLTLRVQRVPRRKEFTKLGSEFARHQPRILESDGGVDDSDRRTFCVATGDACRLLLAKTISR